MKIIIFLIVFIQVCILNHFNSKKLRRTKKSLALKSRIKSKTKLSLANWWIGKQKEISKHSWYNTEGLPDKMRSIKKTELAIYRDLTDELSKKYNNCPALNSQNKNLIFKTSDPFDDTYYNYYKKTDYSVALDWRFGLGESLTKVDILRQQPITSSLFKESFEIGTNELISLRKLSGTLYKQKISDDPKVSYKAKRSCSASLLPNQTIKEGGFLLIRTAAHCLLKNIFKLHFVPYDKHSSLDKKSLNWGFRLKEDFIMDRTGFIYKRQQDLIDKWEKAGWSERWNLDDYVTLTISTISKDGKNKINDIFNDNKTSDLSLKDLEVKSPPSLFYFAYPSKKYMKMASEDKSKYLLMTNIQTPVTENNENAKILYENFHFVCPEDYQSLPSFTTTAQEKQKCQNTFPADKYKKAAYLPMFRGSSGSGIAECAFSKNENNQEQDITKLKKDIKCRIIGVLQGSHLVKKDINSKVEFMGIITTTNDSISKDEILNKIKKKNLPEIKIKKTFSG